MSKGDNKSQNQYVNKSTDYAINKSVSKEIANAWNHEIKKSGFRKNGVEKTKVTKSMSQEIYENEQSLFATVYLIRLKGKQK